jgi:hypothetical protein
VLHSASTCETVPDQGARSFADLRQEVEALVDVAAGELRLGIIFSNHDNLANE